MKIYSNFGINDFVVLLGYKGYMIKQYFVDYYNHVSDITVDIQKRDVVVHQNRSEPWRITLVDTGETTNTGGRIKRAMSYIGDDVFAMTYGDGVGNVDVSRLVAFHRSHGRLATVTGVRPPKRFGVLQTDGTDVLSFEEKPMSEGGWINGGFFVLNPAVVEFIPGDETAWEVGPVQQLIKAKQLSVFYHEEFWQPMDTLRDKNYLEKLWEDGQAPWKIWKDG
jgi:glucose-1-phosphate cytidylyltransferase